MAHRGRIAGRRALLRRDENDRLIFEWRGQAFDLEKVAVRHRDDDGAIAFSVTEPDGTVTKAMYRRKGRSSVTLLMDVVDVTADEPWTWEDSDFGLLVFHASTGTGPVKYRHRFDSRAPIDLSKIEAENTLRIDNDELVRIRHRGRAERVRFADLAEIRVKFEAGGIWAPSSVFVLTTTSDQAVLPLGSSADIERCQLELLPELRRLPGWNDESEAAAKDACEYAARTAVGPSPQESLASRAERPVWYRL